MPGRGLRRHLRLGGRQRAALGAVCLAAAFAIGTPAGSAGATDAAPLPAGPALPFLSDIEVAFDLVDHNGALVSAADFAGRPMVIFFGYTSCESICDVALPSMGAALDALGPDADRLTPILITIDPERDTPERLAEALPIWHDDMVGLTGSEAALTEVWARFRVEVIEVAIDPAGIPIFAHGSFVYLVGVDGEVKTVLPPILSPDRMAELMRKYL